MKLAKLIHVLLRVHGVPETIVLVVTELSVVGEARESLMAEVN